MVLLNFLNWMEQHALPCPIKKYLNINCFGCGCQSSFFALCRGQWLKSFALYPPLLFVLSTIAIFMVNYFVQKKWSQRLVNVFTFVTVVVVVVSRILND